MTRQKTFDVSIITQFYPPDYAATGQLIQELAMELSKQAINIHIFTGQPNYANKISALPLELDSRLIIKRTRLSKFSSKQIIGKALGGFLFCLRAFIHLFKSCWRGEILLITTSPPYLYILGYFTNLLFGLPYFCLIYDLYPDAAVELKLVSKNNLLVKFWDFVNRIVWHRAQGIIVLSSTMKKRIVAKHSHLTEKIHIIHNWADPNRIQPILKQKNWFANKYNLTDKFTILYSGTLGRCHDIDTIFNAAKILQNEPIQFVFIGGGAKWLDFFKKVKEHNLNNFLFLPYQDKKVIPYSLTCCDLSLVSIAPGLEGVVAPSKLYGILAAGKPVAAICESHSYLRQIITDAGCGQAFDNDDEIALAEFIRNLIKNPLQVEAMGQAARKYLESHFTPEIIAKQYAQLLTTFVVNQRAEGAESWL